MTAYDVKINRSAQKAIDGLPLRTKEQVGAAIDALSGEPRPRGTTKLRVEVDTYRIRVGNYRIVYEVDDVARLVDVRTVAHRSIVYRGFILLV